MVVHPVQLKIFRKISLLCHYLTFITSFSTMIRSIRALLENLLVGQLVKK